MMMYYPTEPEIKTMRKKEQEEQEVEKKKDKVVQQLAEQVIFEKVNEENTENKEIEKVDNEDNAVPMSDDHVEVWFPDTELSEESIGSLILAIVCIFCCVIGCILYLNSLNGNFVFDDSMIPESKDITGENGMLSLFYNDYWGDPMKNKQSSKSWRPFTVLTFRWNWLFSEQNAIPYHFVNILLFGICCLTVMFMTYTFFPNIHIVFISGIIFATHPIHVEAIANLVGRAEPLATIFGCAYLICEAYACRVTLAFDSFLYMLVGNFALVLSILSKEQGLMWFPFLIGLELFQPQLLYRGKRNIALSINRVAFSALSAGALFCIRYYVSNGDIVMEVPVVDNPYHGLGLSLLQRTLTYMYLHAYNFYLLLFPKLTNLCADYSYNAIPYLTGFSDPRFFFICLFYTSLVLSCLISLYYTFRQIPSQLNQFFQFTFGLMIATFLPCTNLFFLVGFVIADRTLFIPSVGWSIFFAYLVIKTKLKFQIPYSVIYATLFAICANYSFTTVQRNYVWESEYELWLQDALHCAKGSAKANNNYAWRLMNDKRDFAGAVKHSRIGTLLECEMLGIEECVHDLDKKGIGYINLRDSLRLQAIEFAKMNKMERSLKNFEMLNKIVPSYMIAWQFRVKALRQIGMQDKVQEVQKTCVKKNPRKKRDCMKLI